MTPRFALYWTPLTMLFLAFCFTPFAWSASLAVGESAPDFALTNQKGDTVRLSDYRGQWVVLYFYPKDDTPGCTTEACSFRDNINRLIQRQAVILGVSLDDSASHQAFAENTNCRLTCCPIRKAKWPNNMVRSATIFYSNWRNVTVSSSTRMEKSLEFIVMSTRKRTSPSY